MENAENERRLMEGSGVNGEVISPLPAPRPVPMPSPRVVGEAGVSTSVTEPHAVRSNYSTVVSSAPANTNVSPHRNRPPSIEVTRGNKARGKASNRRPMPTPSKH